MIYNKSLSISEISMLYNGSRIGGNRISSNLTSIGDIWACGAKSADYESSSIEYNSTNVTILNYCGDNIISGSEQCEGSDFNGKTCVTEKGAGYTGSLSCSGCAIVTTACVAPATNTGGAAGGGATGATPTVAAVVTVTTETTTETTQTTETTESTELGETGQATEILFGQSAESVPTAQTGETEARPPAAISVTFTNTGSGVINNPRATIYPIEQDIVLEGDPFYYEDGRYKTTTENKEILYETEGKQQKELVKGVRVFNNEDGTYGSYDEDGTYTVYERDGSSYILEDEDFKEYNKKASSIIGQPWIITIMDQQGNQAETEFVGTEEQMNKKTEQLSSEYKNAEIVPVLKRKFLQDEELVLLHTKKISGIDDSQWTALALKENIRESSLLQWEIIQPENLANIAPGEEVNLNLKIIPPLTTKKTADLKLKLYSDDNVVYDKTITVEIDRSNFEAVADVNEDEKIIDMFMIISNVADSDKEYSIELDLDAENEDNTKFAEYYGPIKIKAKDTEMFAYKYKYSNDVNGEHVLRYRLYENGKLIHKAEEKVELGK